MSKEYLFVYGTLMEGFGNHILLSGQHKIDDAMTEDEFTMHSIGFPFITRDMDHATNILGELYEVDKHLLEGAIDHLEGHPDWYCREKIKIITDNLEKYEAWAYLNPTPRGKLVKDGDFRNFIG